MPGERIDLAALLQGQVALLPEEPADREHRHMLEREQAVIDRRDKARKNLIQDCKDVAVFVALLLALVAVAFGAGWVLLCAKGTTAETQRWAQTILGSTFVGALSFVAGQKTAAK